MPKTTKTTTPATPESAPERSDETTETATPTVEETTVPATAKKTTNKIVPGSKKNTAPVATPATPEKKGKATPKAGPGAAATPKTAPAHKPGEFRWTDKRVAIVKALRALKANGELNARTSLEIQAQAGEEISLNDVKHYLYKDNDLVTEGYTGCVKGLEGLKGIGYFLTEKGRAVKLP